MCKSLNIRAKIFQTEVVEEMKDTFYVQYTLPISFMVLNVIRMSGVEILMLFHLITSEPLD
jgi:hypothetical protein